MDDKGKRSQIPGTNKKPYNAPYTHEYLNRTFFLLKVLAISHLSVRNKPELFNEPGMFAAKSVKGLQYAAKVLKGPAPNLNRTGLLSFSSHN